MSAHTQVLAACLRDEALPVGGFTASPDAFVRACRDEDLSALVYERLRRDMVPSRWVDTVRSALAADARAHAAEELISRRELVAVLELLAAAGVRPVLFKGTAIAYSVYPDPCWRRRRDTDLLIRRDQEHTVRRVLAGAGYVSPPWCDGELLFCQFPLKKIDPFGVAHALDFHWKISTQPVFADLLGFDEIGAGAAECPTLGPHARTAGPLHALLIACIHPVMHHRNADAIVWIYDVHLLASRLTAEEFDRFAELAVAKGVAAICAQQLTVAARWLGTRIPAGVVETLSARGGDEPSARYLRPNRRWRHDLASSLQGLPRWTDRLRLLREVALPNPSYVLERYRVAPAALTALLLPALYVHRLITGGWKVVSGRK